MKHLFFLSSFLFLVMSSFATVIHVPGDQPEIQAGIEIAANGDTVLVADGIYFENINLLGKEITLASYYLIDGDKSHIDNTIIDGSKAADPDKASVIELVSGENRATIISGFTIRNGGGTFPDPEGTRSGGGIYCIESEATLSNNKIVNNLQGVEGTVYGGGIFMYNSEMIISNCLFENNKATRGGGIYSKNSDLEIEYCDFSGNQAKEHAGAVFFANNDNSADNHTLIVNISNFLNNYCEENTAGLMVRNDASNGTTVTFEMDKSKFDNNNAAQRSGLNIRGNNLFYDVYNTVFSFNKADNYAAGVSLSNECSGSFYNCIFNSNNADLSGNGYNSGGVSVWSFAEAEFVNCVFADNKASVGAALTVGGGGIAKAVNSIFWNNSPDQIALTSYDNQGGTLEISYCDIQGGPSQIGVSEDSELTEGDGNLNADPGFITGDEKPYSITEGSPCIDAGTDEGIDLPLGDIIDNFRVWDGNNDGNTIVDIGAYEFDAGPLPLVNEQYFNKNLINAYPNPSISTINFEAIDKNIRIQSFQITDLRGRTIETVDISNGGLQTVRYNTVSLTPGIYFCKVSISGGISVVRFVVK